MPKAAIINRKFYTVVILEIFKLAIKPPKNVNTNDTTLIGDPAFSSSSTMPTGN